MEILASWLPQMIYSGAMSPANPSKIAITALVAALLLSGCEREQELYSGKSGKESKTGPATPASKPASALAAAKIEKVEVEMSGIVEIPPKVKGKLIKIYVADKNCLDEKATVFGAVPIGDTGNFFAEVFPPTGTDLSLCAAVDEGDGKPSRAYGALDHTLHAVGKGEVIFSKLKIKLKAGPPHLFRSR